MRRDNNPRRAETFVLAAIGPERATLSQYHDRLSLYVTEADARAALDRLTRRGVVTRDNNGGMRRDMTKWTRA